MIELRWVVRGPSRQLEYRTKVYSGRRLDATGRTPDVWSSWTLVPEVHTHTPHTPARTTPTQPLPSRVGAGPVDIVGGAVVVDTASFMGDMQAIADELEAFGSAHGCHPIPGADVEVLVRRLSRLVAGLPRHVVEVPLHAPPPPRPGGVLVPATPRRGRKVMRPRKVSGTRRKS